MWPLDSAIGATTAHKASKGVVDGTCTQVWAWMTNKCRKRMNQRKGYIIWEISHKGGPRKGDEVGIHILGQGVLFPRALGHLVLFLTAAWSSPISTQAVTPSEPSFWTQFLQIHCNGSAGPRSPSVTGPSQKTVTLQILNGKRVKHNIDDELSNEKIKRNEFWKKKKNHCYVHFDWNLLECINLGLEFLLRWN